MATSTVYATKVAIKALLDASTSLGAASPKVPVWWGRPNWEHNYTENVYVEDSDDSIDWASLGGHSRDENYTIVVRVEVFRHGKDGQATELRMWTLAHAVEAAISADVSLGSTVRDSRVSRIQQTLEPIADGYIAAADLTVDVQARI